MTAQRTAIVVTTIFEPRFLEGYLSNIASHGHTDRTELIVIIDRKTPASVAAACADAAARGFRVLCPTLDEQEAFLARFPSMSGRIPYDSDNRRNIGFLMALERGAEVLISIDDDNFCLPDSDFVGEHGVVGNTVDVDGTSTTDGWFNIGTLLETKGHAEPVFPRGFPYFARKRAREVNRHDAHPARVALNAGLWLSDPDVDALTRIAIGPHVTEADRGATFLAQNTWSPINTQNTALSRDAIAAYYYVRMGYSLGGLTIDRYGDILSGYFLQACIKARGEAIRIGSPVADHVRTPHNLFKDLYHELAGVVILEDLLPWLTELPLNGTSYPELYAHLADEIDAVAGRFHGFIWDQGGGGFLRDTAANMRVWLKTVEAIG